MEEAQSAFLLNRLLEDLHNSNIWRVLRILGLSPKPRDGLNSFTPDEFNKHLAAVSISHEYANYYHSSIISSALRPTLNSRKLHSMMALLGSPVFPLSLGVKMAYRKVW